MGLSSVEIVEKARRNMDVIVLYKFRKIKASTNKIVKWTIERNPGALK